MPVPQVNFYSYYGIFYFVIYFKIDERTHNVEITGIGIKKNVFLTVDDIKKNFEQVKIQSVIQWLV